MRRDRLIMVLQNFAALLVAVVIVCYVSGLRLALLAVPVGAALAMIVSVFELRLKDRLDRASELNDTLFALHTIHSDIKYSGKSLGASIGDAEAELRDRVGGNVHSTLGEIGKRLTAGQDLSQAIESACRGKSDAASEALRAVGREYSKGIDPASAVGNVYARLRDEQSMDREKAYGSLQKYLTMGMALSAVLPSFVVFAFVGYSMVYFSASLLYAFSIVMLMVLPRVYALLRIHVAGMYAQ
jgi:Flp pilus assembly protein TadB